jgi:segregation and condensation protein B
MSFSPAYPQLVPRAVSSRDNHWRWREAGPQTESETAEPSHHSVNVRDRKMARLEAVLLVADGAFTFRRLAQLATLADASEARDFVDQLNESYDRVGSAFRIERVATGCRMMTRPQYARWIDRLHNRQAKVKLSPAMMETLSIVAYRQPVTRAEIEKVRGVQSAEMLKQLMERSYVRITGEDDSLGRPFLYGTTRQFLEAFGLKDLNSMPMSESLRRVIQEEPIAPAEEDDSATEPANEEEGEADDEEHSEAA